MLLPAHVAQPAAVADRAQCLPNGMQHGGSPARSPLRPPDTWTPLPFSSLDRAGENFDNLALLVTLCTLSALLPLPLLRLLPADVDEAKEKEDGGDGSSGDGGERKES